MYTPPKQPPAPKIVRLSQKDWLKGYQSTLDDDRKDKNGLKTASNVQIEQNGTVRPRPSLVLYGEQPTGTVLGQVFPFVKMSGSTAVNYEACVQNVAGTAKVYVRTDGGSWSVCNGKTYDTTARCHIEQVNSKLLITNGVDNLSYLDIDSLTVVPFVALSTPTGAAAANGGSTNLTTGPSFNWRVRVTATNTVGETAASTAGTIQLNKVRDQWAGGATEYLTYTWNRVTNATRYNIYVGDQAGYEYYLDTVVDFGSGATQSYKDDGSLALNSNRLAPNGDSTAGPKATRTTNVLGRVYMVGDADNPYRLWFGGDNTESSLDFSPFNGGGWVEVDKGGKNFPVAVRGFRTGKGDAVASVFMKGQSGTGKHVHALPSATTLGDTIITYLDISEANGQTGTDAPDAVVYARDSLWTLSRNGFIQTRTKPQIQSILSTDNFSEQIMPDVKSLNVNSLDYAVALPVEHEGRLYFALPSGSDTNNQMWVFDLDRGGIWSLPWNIDADWLWLADDSTGFTRLMVLKDNQTYELTYSQSTQDDTTAFSTNVGSGIIKFSDDGMEWASVIDVTFVVLRPQGSLTFSITGKTLDEPIAPVASEPFTPSYTMAGWNEAGWNTNYWNEVVTIPETFGVARDEFTIEIDEELQWMTWEISTTAAGVDYQLSEVVIRFVPVGVIHLD